MTDAQRKVVIVSLIIIGLVLPFVMLDWRHQYGLPVKPTPIWIFYEEQRPNTYSDAMNRWGIYTSHGVTGIFLGTIVPLCLFAVAAFLALAKKDGR